MTHNSLAKEREAHEIVRRVVEAYCLLSILANDAENDQTKLDWRERLKDLKALLTKKGQCKRFEHRFHTANHSSQTSCFYWHLHARHVVDQRKHDIACK